jgi:DnaJ-class molecular chaperone
MKEIDIDDHALSPGSETEPGSPGSDEALCPDCGGTGLSRSGETCPTCAGTGRIIEGVAGA